MIKVKLKDYSDLNKQIKYLVDGLQKDLISMKATIDKKNKQLNQSDQVIRAIKIEYQNLADENIKLFLEIENSKKQRKIKKLKSKVKV